VMTIIKMQHLLWYRTILTTTRSIVLVLTNYY
jgi:hypothetical protein